jgi:HK97 family phage prohead protease
MSGPVLLTTTGRDAARERARQVRQHTDRPARRRADEAPRSTARVPARLSRAEIRDGQAPGTLVFDGMASVTGRAYEMWDLFGPYEETVHVGAFAETLAAEALDVPLVIGHDQLRRIARTGNAVSPLILDEVADVDPTGLHVLAPALPGDDVDVRAIAPKIRAGLMDEMSFAFRIVSGRWSEDWTEYHIHAVDIHRGDVAIVGYGANPHTSAALRAAPDARLERLHQARRAEHLAGARSRIDVIATSATARAPRPAPCPDGGSRVPAPDGRAPTPAPVSARDTGGPVTLQQLLARYRAERDRLVAERAQHETEIAAARAALVDTATIEEIDAAEAKAKAARAQVAAVDTRIKERDEAIADVESAIADEKRIEEGQKQRNPTGAPQVRTREQTVRVGAEERTYAPHKERAWDSRTERFRPGFDVGQDFLRDVAAAFLMQDWEAQDRLRRHKQEELAERGQYMTRATGTGAFAGLTVPQYLTDLYAPAAAAARPFANAIRGHELPASGMTVELSRITTPSAVGLQAAQNSLVTEQDMDDTQLSIPVQTTAGRQTMSRQAVERSTNAEDVTVEDLTRRYFSSVDSTIINQAATGLVAVGTAVAYTDLTPTAAELYPKVLEALSGVEAALLDQASGETLAVMHSRRWYWMQSQVGTTWPFIGQPGIPAQQGGVNLAERYGAGFRGILPNGTPVVVDNNIPTNLGAGTNEDVIGVVDRNECHLWEDPDAPLFIRAEQTAVTSLGVTLVLYGYFAYTHARYAQARVIGGTGLIPPTF